jgi:four helix bundle protein
LPHAPGMEPLYRSLIAWQRADDLFFTIHRITRGFPRSERFELTSQIRRAALSVPTNIVEGSARFGSRERVQLPRTARASLVEPGYLMYVANRLEHLKSDVLESLEDQIRETAALLRGLIKRWGATTTTDRSH